MVLEFHESEYNTAVFDIFATLRNPVYDEPSHTPQEQSGFRRLCGLCWSRAQR